MKDREVERIGAHLSGKNIALLVTGGIASYKTPSIARHLRHYGANVQVYATSEALEYIGKKSLEWASVNPVISELSAEAEHLREFDAYVVAPATYNTIGKIANGIADNAVTTTMASAIGRCAQKEAKILVAPAMHDTMQNAVYSCNLEKLCNLGIKIIPPVKKLGKANLPDSHAIVVETIRELSRSKLKGRRVLITAGPTPGKIDGVRYITNRFRGALGLEIAEEAYLRGANVQFILGPGGLKPPAYLHATIIRDFNEYYAEVMRSAETAEIGIFSAAVADYIPKEVYDGKIPSQGALKSIELKETPKVIKEVREKFKEMFMATFKYEEKITRERLEEIAKSRVAQGYELVVANRKEDMGISYNGIIVDETGVISEPGSKKACARSLLNIVEEKYEKN